MNYARARVCVCLCSRLRAKVTGGSSSGTVGFHGGASYVGGGVVRTVGVLCLE